MWAPNEVVIQLKHLLDKELLNIFFDARTFAVDGLLYVVRYQEGIFYFEELDQKTPPFEIRMFLEKR